MENKGIVGQMSGWSWKSFEVKICGSEDEFRKLRAKKLQIFVVYSYGVQFNLFVFPPCPTQFAKPNIYTMNPNGLQK